MIKVLNQYFPGRLFVLLATENVVILLGVWAAVSWHVGDPRLSLLTYPQMFSKALLITVVCQVCLYYADIYDLRQMTSKADILVRLLQALGAAALILAALFYIFPETRLGNGIAETSLIVGVLGILVWRVVVEWLNRAYSAGERILLVGSGKAVQDLMREIRLRRDLPLSVIGSVVESGLGDQESLASVPVLGSVDELARVISERKPDRVVIALRERRQQLPINELLRLRTSGVIIEEGASLYEKVTGKIPVESIRPSSLIFSDGFRHSAMMRAYGRICGLVSAAVALVLVGPLMLLVALAIKLDSRGPALYRQERVGKDGKSFDILKFRSMRTDAESMSGPVWAQEKDPRITRVGRLIRKVRLDELPQLLNVLKGEMSFVGPRPERPFFVDLLQQQIPFFELRHAVRPGITGWAQVSAQYGASVDEAKEKLEYDLFYVKNMSLSLDLLILFQTIKIVIFGRGAR